MSADTTHLSIVIVTFGARDGLTRCLGTVRTRTPAALDIVIVDNPHPDKPQPDFGALGDVRVFVNDSNLGFAAAADRGASEAATDLLCFLNPDTEVEAGWFPPLEAALRRPGVGAAVPLLLAWDGTIQDAGALLSRDGTTVAWGAGGDPDDERFAFPRVVSYGSGACMLIRRDTFLEAGGFPAVYTPAYCEDVDLGRTLAASGLSTVIEPRSRVRHRSGAAEDRASVDAMVRRSTRTLRSRWWRDLDHRPSLAGWEQRFHRLMTARDADTTGRVMVAVDTLPVIDSPLDRSLLDVAHRWPGARVTLVTTDPDADSTRYLDAGIEVARAPDGDWFAERRFLYDLVATDGAVHERLAYDLDRTQPQALVVGVDEFASDPVGVAASAGIATRSVL